MYADGTFETERHQEEDDESMSEETEGEEEDGRTCLKVNQAKPVEMDTLSRVLKNVHLSERYRSIKCVKVI